MTWIVLGVVKTLPIGGERWERFPLTEDQQRRVKKVTEEDQEHGRALVSAHVKHLHEIRRFTFIVLLSLFLIVFVLPFLLFFRTLNDSWLGGFFLQILVFQHGEEVLGLCSLDLGRRGGRKGRSDLVTQCVE